MKFSDLGLAAPILRALHSQGYHTPTAIQAKAIPIILAGHNALGVAQTGTGKTAAFALPVIQRLSVDRRQAPRKSCRVLVLTPTRELASQVAQSFRVYGQHLSITVAVVFGGVGHAPQTRALACGVDVLVATPGRLIDHIAECNVTLAGMEVLVLDEADQMLDLGFWPSIRRIVAKLAPKQQNLFFSATMPSEIGNLANELLRDPAGSVRSTHPVDDHKSPVRRRCQRSSQRGHRYNEPSGGPVTSGSGRSRAAPGRAALRGECEIRCSLGRRIDNGAFNSNE